MQRKIRQATWTCAVLLAVPALLLPAARSDVSAAAGPGVQTPNYELASQWTTAKIDTTVRLEVEVPKDAEIPGMKTAPPAKTNTAGDKQGDDDALSSDPQQRRGGAAGNDEDNSDKKSVFFEYDLASAKLTLLPDFKDPKKPRWASVSPDDATIVFARGHNLLTMDAAGYAKARVPPGDAPAAEAQNTTDGQRRL